ncbi:MULTISPECIES: DUF4132 domain-containing protein [Catenuloplanes]|uniref:DUF4132 domain-containing protein n=1 Tax=Catenuloplanes niger TaxID=587534 RepID=A0AAE3ZMV0_9ACTN|nr:DUF4132 domain-containing protein [Catenuloplanes niger]MDR7320760.1 hypothetical protein [Catenuloplanes niger]
MGTQQDESGLDAELTLQGVAGSIRYSLENWPTREVDEHELQGFIRQVALVYVWTPADRRAALLAAFADPQAPIPLLPEQRRALPAAVERAERLAAPVALLEGSDADHDQRVAAAREMIRSLQDARRETVYGPDRGPWPSAVDAMRTQAIGVLRTQPAGVRQVLFDEWTAAAFSTYGAGPYDDLALHMLGGDVDGTAWLDAVGGFHSHGAEGLTWELVEAEHAAGRTHSWALAVRRRAQIEDYRDLDVYATWWPVPNPGEPWAERAVAEVEGMPAERRSAWHALLSHCVPAVDSTRPSALWRKQVRPLLDAVGTEEFAARVDGWLELVGAPRTRPLYDPGPRGGCGCGCEPGRVRTLRKARSPRHFDRYNVRLLAGLLWARALCPPSEELLRHLGRIAERATAMISGHGAASPKLANAAVAVLAGTDHPVAVAQLARLASRVKYKGTLRLIEKGLDARATALGIPREDVEEMALPGYGLPLADSLGDCSYEVALHGMNATMTWRNANGKPVKAVPAQVRAEFGEELKELKATVKDIGATLIATRDRLEGLLRRDRRWTAGAWRERLLDHPLARVLARRLIWTVDGVAVCWAGDTLRTVDDTALVPGDDAEVRLWHPVVEEAPVVAAWREFLVRHEITQPFKQAHREQYLLTDAERATGTYSNRFAAHVVLQHRLHAVMSRRGWWYELWRNDPYSKEHPHLKLPDLALRAELTLAGMDVRESDDITFDTMVTDQLLFLPSVPLERIPAVVLSEVMRDVDLFVAVAGVGSDPDWFDGGPHGRYREYWTRSSFGELAPSGTMRREVLAGLIPQLAIADRCTLGERFLEVRGSLHTYRIHYGSGNILIAPDDRYLCIIPASAKRAAEPDLYLPFEGDSRLSEIISKALLLAADEKIEDQVILHQL